MRSQTLLLSRARAGFSLIEVVLAIGIFMVTVLALVGLLGPTLKSVDDVGKTDEAASVVNAVYAFLQNSPDINPGGSRFNAIYRAVESGNHATIFAYRWFDDDASVEGEPPVIRLEIGFGDNEGGVIGRGAVVNAGDASFEAAAGPIYRVVLSASPSTPDIWLSPPTRNSTSGVYSLGEGDPAVYSEGYLAMEVRVFAREVDMQAVTGSMPSPSLADLAQEDPIFTYNTAVVR